MRGRGVSRKKERSNDCETGASVAGDAPWQSAFIAAVADRLKAGADPNWREERGPNVFEECR
jgi:hypothetical protein